MTATPTLTPLPTPAVPAPGRTRPVALDGVRALLRSLDREQRRAVTAGDGPHLVVAGPGTGKTEVITRRIAWLILGGRARGSEILGLTFTERAAAEMQERVDVLVPYGRADTSISTFHAFGDAVLREHGHEIGLPPDPRVVGRAEAVVLLREHVFDLGLDRYLPSGDPTRFVGALVDLFATAKEQGIGPADLAFYADALRAGAGAVGDEGIGDAAEAALAGLRDEAASVAELSTAFARYQQLLRDRGFVDHGDQVAEAVRVLEDRPVVAAAMRRRFRYIVVDEAQDTDPAQVRLVAQLAGRGGSVMFVGDDDQAIYGFRGAVGQALGSLDTTYPSLRRVVLRRNHRSRQPILDAARRLIRHNDPHRLEVSHGLDKTLTSTRRVRRQTPVRHVAYPTAMAEAEGVATAIAERVEAGSDPASIAVLVRANADAGPVIASLEARGVPVRTPGTSRLLRHREVRDVVSLLRTIASPDSSEDLYAVMTADAYGIGGADLTALCELASRRRRPLWAIVRDVVEQPGLLRLSGETRSRLGRVVADLDASIERSHTEPATSVLYAHLRESGWLRSLIARADSGDEEPVRRVARLFELVAAQADLVGDPRATIVVPALSAIIDAGDEPRAPKAIEEDGRVAVLTVHQAKGSEFAVVHVIGMSEGRFPSRGRPSLLRLPTVLLDGQDAADPAVAMEEERRLAYVAMTRARDELILSHATVGSRGNRERGPSRFIAEALDVPLADLEPATSPPPGFGLPATGPTTTTAPRPAATDAALDLSYTQVDDYLTCPKKYRLRHGLRVPTPPHHALVVGNALHQAVAVANGARQRGEPIDAAAVERTFAARWRSEGFLSDRHETARYEAGLDALRRFRERVGRDAEARVEAVERPFSVTIGRDRVRGRYDVVERTPDGVSVIDYKSGDVRDPERARTRARDSLQLRLYALAWEAEHGERPANVALHFLEGDLVGAVSPSDRQLRSAEAKVARAADGIRAGAFEATPGYPACEWCPYRRICSDAA